MWSRLSLSVKLAVTMIVILVLGASNVLNIVRPHNTNQVVTTVTRHAVPFSVDVSSAAATFNHLDGVMNSYLLAGAEHNPALEAKKWTKVQGLQTELLQDFRAMRHTGVSGVGVRQLEAAWAEYDHFVLLTHQAIVAGNLPAAIQAQTVSNSLATQAMNATIARVSRSAGSLITNHLHAAQRSLNGSRDTTLVALFITMLVTLVAMWMQWKGIARPLRQLTRVAEGLARGDVNQEVPQTMDDETGQLAEAFRRLMAYVQRLVRVAQAIGAGDLRERVELAGSNDELGQAIQIMQTHLNALLAETQQVGFTVHAQAERVAAASERTGAASQQIAATIQQTTTATTQSAQGLQAVAERVQDVSEAGTRVADSAKAQ
ncbi:MAG: HAMP domain-containing protein, partial [Clostridia bacterium]